jgi:predicted nucleic acid-binding protein
VTADALILDASVAIAIVWGEPTAPALLELVRASVAHGGRRLVPDDFWLELTNVLIRRHGASPEEAVEALREVDDFDLESVRLDRPLLLATLDLQARFGLSSYDAAYLALANAEDAQLLTLDVELARAAGRRTVRLPGAGRSRLSEESTSYGHEAIDWARFGPYLARLRAEARDAAASRSRSSSPSS